MSKVSSNYPNYSSSKLSLGGSNASTGVVNGVLNADYNMSDSEAAIYDYALNTLASVLPNLNTFDTNTQSSIKSEVDAYKNSGVRTINDLYASSLMNLENDAASRFGNLDNSFFKDELNSLESERAGSVSSFAQNVLAKQSGLESEELNKRYALVNLLSGLSGDIYSNALNAISTSLSGSSSANNYNSNVYDALSSMANTNSSSSSSSPIASLLSSLLGSGDISTLSSILKL